MTCDEFILARETGGTLRRLRARRHLGRCPKCAAEAARLDATLVALASAEPLTRRQRMLWMQAAGTLPGAPHRRWPITAGVGAACAAVALLVLAGGVALSLWHRASGQPTKGETLARGPELVKVIPKPSSDSDATLQELRQQLAAPGAPGESNADQVALRPSLGATPLGNLGRLSLEAQLSRAALIVQARIVGWDDSSVHYAVERTIYGLPVPDKTLSLDGVYSGDPNRKLFMDLARRRFVEQEKREPTDDELFTAVLKDHGIELDKRVILLLQPRPAGGYISWGSFFDAPPGHPLDDTVQEIVKIIGDGGFLEIEATQGLGDIFAEELRRADTIMRAKLLKVDDKAAHWQVEKTIRGKEITTPLDIPHDLFRLRAQAVVEQAALKDESLMDLAKRDARIAEEMKAMIKAELLPGHEAILFLGKVTPAGDTARADVLYRVYDTSTRVKLDDLEKLIAVPQTLETDL